MQTASLSLRNIEHFNTHYEKYEIADAQYKHEYDTWKEKKTLKEELMAKGFKMINKRMLKKQQDKVLELKKYSDINYDHQMKTKYLEEQIERYMEYLVYNDQDGETDYVKIKQ